MFVFAFDYCSLISRSIEDGRIVIDVYIEAIRVRVGAEQHQESSNSGKEISTFDFDDNICVVLIQIVRGYEYEFVLESERDFTEIEY